MMNSFKREVGLRLILKSGSSILRSCTEEQARSVIDVWIKGGERTIGSVIGTQIEDVWCVLAEEISFVDIVDLNQIQTQQQTSQQRGQYGPPVGFTSGGKQW